MTEKKPTYTYDDPDANAAAIIEATRREKREPWKAIAADYGISHTTLMNAVARYRAAQRKVNQ